jgi:hypothetical protein
MAVENYVTIAFLLWVKSYLVIEDFFVNLSENFKRK